MSHPLSFRTFALTWLSAIVIALLTAPYGSAATDASDKETKAKADAEKKAAAKPVLLLKYGDGKPDGKKSIAGAGEMIRFTMPKGQTNALKALRIHAARYGYPQPPKEDVEITILTEDMKEPLHTELVSYALFKRQQESRWTQVPFEDPVDVPAMFWVVLNFNAEATKGVYVSFDTSTKGKHSRVGFNDQDAKETEFKGDWMVQAVLAK
jgi:hypothetical protein